eukprot:CAMPEP_0174728696 /NCGR_PEP_ID=MMETSP1094-20130205/52241_1 /TAXON_ID=156173 /ORGANISM="Chrysochromulina brevifilum, Strain UTEX LB 985" /LENGTH=129 /DNA_ID=CAMNT_0015930665 /DNA_START=35 /DNA_END=421 /DNA_ORIENTATION=-
MRAALLLGMLAPSCSLRVQPPIRQPALRALPKAPTIAAANALLLAAPSLLTPMPAFADDGPGFSQASYYTTLALYVVSFPGVYSLVKRSVKSKIVRKTYEVAGPASDGGRPTRELAGDIVAFFQANNYK